MTDLVTSTPVRAPGRSLPSLIAGVRETASLPLRNATTLPPGVYCSQEWFDFEVEYLLRPNWLCIGHVGEVPEPGNYKSIDVIGEQLVMVRDRQRIFRVLSRVCLHRWMEVATGSGTLPAFQCPYHLWTFSLSGRLVGAPEMKGVEFDKASCSLPEIRHEVWNGYVFINLDGNAEPLGPQLAPLQAQLDAVGATSEVLSRQVPVRTYTNWADGAPDGIAAWDWKVFIENFMECYHHIGPHAKSLQRSAPAHMSTTDTSNNSYSLLYSPTNPDFVPPPGRIKRDGPSPLVHVYPNAAWALRKEGSSMHRVFPVSPGRSECISIYLANPEDFDTDEKYAEMMQRYEFADSINEEDKGVNKGVQKAVLARNAQKGRLSHLEQPLWEFYQWIDSQIPAGLS